MTGKTIKKLLALFVIVMTLCAYAVPAYAETRAVNSTAFKYNVMSLTSDEVYTSAYTYLECQPTEAGTEAYISLNKTTSEDLWFVIRALPSQYGSINTETDAYVTVSFQESARGDYYPEYYSGYGQTSGIKTYLQIVTVSASTKEKFNQSGEWDV